jgi:hypothetical protein
MLCILSLTSIWPKGSLSVVMTGLVSIVQRPYGKCKVLYTMCLPAQTDMALSRKSRRVQESAEPRDYLPSYEHQQRSEVEPRPGFWLPSGQEWLMYWGQSAQSGIVWTQYRHAGWTRCSRRTWTFSTGRSDRKPLHSHSIGPYTLRQTSRLLFIGAARTDVRIIMKRPG